MPKMCAIPQLVSASFNHTPTAKHFMEEASPNMSTVTLTFYCFSTLLISISLSP